MSKTRIFAKSDPIFKMIFGDPENKTALIGLLREIIDIPEEEYAHIEIIDPNLRVNKSYGKSGILDIKLTTKSGQRINVEIQIRKASDLIATNFVLRFENGRRAVDRGRKIW